jgi:hypothetical protein
LMDKTDGSPTTSTLLKTIGARGKSEAFKQNEVKNAGKKNRAVNCCNHTHSK